MPKQLLVCFECREVKPVINIGGVYDAHRSPSNICNRCGSPMELRNNNIKVPKKRDDKGWSKFNEYSGKIS